MTTRLELILAAERLFATEDLDAVSMRQIARAAGARNHFAAQYHFVTKPGLLHAIFKHRLEPIEQRRAEMIAALPTDNDAVTIRQLVACIVLPATDVVFASPPTYYFRFLAKIGPRLGRERTIDELAAAAPNFASVARQTEARLSHLPASIRAQRMKVALGGYVVMLADLETAIEASTKKKPVDAVPLTEDIISMLAAMLAAPLLK